MVALDLPDNPSQNGGRATSPKGARDMSRVVELENAMTEAIDALKDARSQLMKLQSLNNHTMKLLLESEERRVEAEKKLAMLESDKSVDDILGSDLRPKEGV